MPFRSTICLLLFCLAAPLLEAQSGFVRSGNQPIPGASVTAAQGQQKLTTFTDGDGHYTFPPLADGSWDITVTMFGFEPFHQQVNYNTVNHAVNFQLKLAESAASERLRRLAGRTGGGQNDTELQAALNETQPETTQQPGAGNESFLVSGSLSQGLSPNAPADTSPEMRQFNGPGGPGEPGGGPQAGSFGQGGPGGGGGGFGPGGGGGFGPGGGGGGGRGGFGGGRGGNRGQAQNGQRRFSSFGNRRGPNSIRGSAFFNLNNSALNAKPFSITGQDIPQPAYAQSRFGVLLGGPLVIPKLVKDPSTFFFFNYFGTRAKNAQSAVETVPTALERAGDFSQSVESAGPVQIYDPTTQQPFPGNVIPSSRLAQNPISKALLSYLPLPNQPGVVNNYQMFFSVPQNTDNLGLRIQRNISKKDRLAYHFNFQRRDGYNEQPYQFIDTTSGSGLAMDLTWTRTISSSLINNAKITFNRNRNETTPYFANGVDIASQLGIAGTSSNPINYGPPNLDFTNFGAVSDASPVLTRNQSQAFGESMIFNHGNHSITVGMDYRRTDLSTRTDTDGRGTFQFTGLATSAFDANGQPISGTGFDFADYLLGLPQSASIRYGDTNTYFDQNIWDGFAQDNWHALSSLTITAGIRYEYFSPLAEKYGRIANLDIAPGFTGVAVVTPGVSGPYSGAFPAGLMNSDLNNVSPRLGLAWKVPHLKRSTLIRAGYGIYYNGQIYNQFATRLAGQPPFAVSNNVVTSTDNVLTIQDGFASTAPGKNVTNTYAVDRYFRVPYAQTWSFSVQNELSRGMFLELGYLGTKGTRLDIETSPNRAAPGDPLTSEQRRRIGNATGFTFDSSDGNSIYHALQARITQRSRKGISWSARYVFSKSIDDSSTFGGAGNTVAQDFTDLSAERGLSSFDRRHTFNANWVFTSRIGQNDDTLVGKLLREWTLSGSMTAQTGTPLTARVLGNLSDTAGTGTIGSGRASATGLDLSSSSGFFNLAAFAPPIAGQFGNAGRNTIPGPSQFFVNLGFGRAFKLDESSRRRLEFRLEANNVFNQVSYTSFNTVVNATNYGLPVSASSMRNLSALVRLRF